MNDIKISETRITNIFRIELPRERSSDDPNTETYKFIDWCEENLVEEDEFNTLDDLDKVDNVLGNGNLVCHFAFSDDTAAMAFKLRWL